MPATAFEITPHRSTPVLYESCAMPDPEPVVYVVDDDISVRESLEMLLINEGWRAKIFPSALEFMASPRADAPGCLVLDVNLPDLSGLELQSLIADDQAGMPIIFITGFGDIPTTVQAMKAGAAEFLTKPIDDDSLISAIRTAVERSRASRRERAVERTLQAVYETLSRREREVLALVVRGLMNKQVGGELGISEITVKAHRGQVMRKMKAGSLAELIEMAARLNIRRGGPGDATQTTRPDQRFN